MNRMTRAVDGMGNVAEYLYNGLGHRTGMRQGAAGCTGAGRNPDFGMDGLLPETPEVWNKETEYILDFTRGFHNLLQKEEDGTIQSYIWDSEAVFMEENGESYSYLNDMQGSVMRLLNHGGESEITYRYDEFGADLTGNQGQFQPFGYTGYQKDVTAGTCYAQAREYDAWSGRFTSEDIIKGSAAYPETLNAYGYCLLNPLKYIDPTGEVYIIAWSYGRDDVLNFEKWYSKKYKVSEINIDGNTSDWSDEMWNQFNKRCSFARAAQTKYNELIKQGILPEDIVVERIDDGDGFVKCWKEWAGYESVQQVHVYSHGTAGRPEIHGGTSGSISDTDVYPKLKWGTDEYTYEPVTYFYGCHTATDSTQKYADNQGVVTYGNVNAAAFSYNPNKRENIEDFSTEGDVYLATFGVFDESTSMKIIMEHIFGWILGRVYVPMTRYNPNCED